MNGCRALKDSEVKSMLAALDGARDRALLILGLKSGFRISELLSLRVRDVWQHGAIVDRVAVQRRHMKKRTEGREVALHADAKAALISLIGDKTSNGDFYVFQSQKGFNRPLGRIQAWRILSGAANACKLQGKVATHSMRKTFASKVYDKLGKDLIKTQRALGHRNINSTVSYLAFRQEDIDDAVLAI